MWKLFPAEFVQSAVGCHNNACSSVINGDTQEAEQNRMHQTVVQTLQFRKECGTEGTRLCLLLAVLDY